VVGQLDILGEIEDLVLILMGIVFKKSTSKKLSITLQKFLKSILWDI
jgi:hypothetical protein